MDCKLQSSTGLYMHMCVYATYEHVSIFIFVHFNVLSSEHCFKRVNFPKTEVLKNIIFYILHQNSGITEFSKVDNF